MKKLLVVIDYQNDFVDGALGFEKAKSLENGIYNKVKTYLNNSDKVLFTYDTHLDNYLNSLEGRNLPVNHCILGSSGHKLYGRLEEFLNDENIIHHNKFGFGISPVDMTNLAKQLGEDILEIELIGVVTNICVISNFILFKSQYRECNIIVDASLCASFDENLHNKALDVIEGLQGIVINR